jgi:hypothetical protein
MGNRSLSESTIEPVERTFYAPILRLLENLGFVGAQEIKLSQDGLFIDILFKLGANKYVLEVKIGEGTREFLKSIVQAYEYGIKYGTNNIIVIRYPKDVRKINNLEKINEVAIDRTCESIFLTDSWYEYVELSPQESLNQLKAKIDKKLLAVQNIEHASKILKDSIRVLSRMISKGYDKEKLEKLFDYLTKDFGLFKGLSETKKKLDNQLMDLLAYILVNQILFYFLYSKRKPESLPEIKGIHSLDDLERYFGKIRNINFKPIFDIEVIKKIPPDAEIIDVLNSIILCLSALRIEEIRHDLYGRLIGKSLPEETRRILASYYTKINSAELLAKLTISRGDETVWDLACGSGTLLVSAYKRKMELCEQGSDLEKEDRNALHKKFLEEDLTGTDIMPFACHLSGLNLSAQNLDVATNFIRIANKNSLGLYILPTDVKEAYGDISSAIERIKKRQKTLYDYNERRAVEERIASKVFTINKVEAVLINPPFTRISKLPETYRKECQKEELSKISGNRINFWGNFLALADKVLVNGGQLGAIIPISFLRGKDTLKIRQYFFDNYSFEYIIKPAYNSCFSEGTDFTDMMIVARKNICEEHQKVKIVTLHSPIEVRTLADIDAIARNLRASFKPHEDNSLFSVTIVKQTELREKIENLMPFVYTENAENQKRIDNIAVKLLSNSKIGKLDNKLLKDGFQKLRPRGKSKELIITNAYSNSRLERANLYFKDDYDKDILHYFDKDNKKLDIEKNRLTKTLRTITGIDRIDISQLYDYIIGHPTAPPENTHLVIANRLRLNSDNTFVIAAYSDEKIKPTNAFFMYLCSIEQAKITCLFMHSVFYLVQFVRLSKQSTSDYREIKQADLQQMLFPTNLTECDKIELLKFFDDNRTIHVSNIRGQLKNKEKMQLDLLLARLLNIAISNNELGQVYESLVEELRT